MESQRIFVINIGKVDITPPRSCPSLAILAHRTDNAAGVRTRLYARALYLEDARGEHVVLVQCDLGAISALLHLQVARAIVRDGYLRRSLAYRGNAYACGPGRVFWGGVLQLLGLEPSSYDPHIVTFLTERIANAVLAAYRTRAPAKLAIGHMTIFGLTHNRSIEAYNSNKSHIVSEEALWTMLPEYRAVDPTFTMLRVDRIVGAGTPTPWGVHELRYPWHGRAVQQRSL